MSATAATTAAASGSRLLEAVRFETNLCATIIATQPGWEQLLDTIESPQLRKNMAFGVGRIRESLGLEADHALAICQGRE